MSLLSPQQEKVRKHYQELADSYGSRANQTCERAYQQLVQRFMKGRSRILELGSGCSAVLGQVCDGFGVASDLSLDMLRARRPHARISCVVAAGERLPFRDGAFDGLFNINVLEHVTDVAAVARECSRVLERDGLWLSITPNGNWEYFLDLAERWSLKIPEGPHRFLTTADLRRAVAGDFAVVEHRTFLMLPAGPTWLGRWVDRLTLGSTFGWGFFQYMAARKK